jgi:hypothetical protein
MRKTPLNGKNGKNHTSVTFEVPAEVGAQRAFVVGEFNGG